MRQRLLACAAGAALTTASLVTPPLAGADVSEDYFLNELYKTHQKWYWPYGEQYIIGMGRGVCADWAAGVSYADEVESLAVSKRWTHRNARYFVALATGAFCADQYTTMIPPDDRIPVVHPGG